MTTFRLQRSLDVRLWLPCIVFLGLAAPLAGDEPAREFLVALRAARYHDIALDYLDAAQTSRTVSERDREVLGYERGVTWMEIAGAEQDPALREKQYEEAEAALSEFVAQLPSHVLAISAKLQQGNLLVELARLKLKRAGPSTALDQPKLKGEAKRLYASAHRHFQGISATLRTALEAQANALNPKRNPRAIEQREQMLADFLQAQMLSAAVLEESADGMDKSSQEYKDTLAGAAEEYRAIHERYRSQWAGLHARMYQGRSLQKLGRTTEALTCYEEVLGKVAEHEEFRELHTRMLLLAIDGWVADPPKNSSQIVQRGKSWLGKAIPSERESAEYLAISLAVARSSKLYGEQLRKNTPDDPRVAELLADARKLAQQVASVAGDHQDAARNFLRSLDAETKIAESQAAPRRWPGRRRCWLRHRT